MVAAVLLEWWMWFCWSCDPLERSGPSLELQWWLSSSCPLGMQWQCSHGVPSFRLYPGRNVWFLPLGRASHSGTMWFCEPLLWHLDGPLEETAPGGSYQSWTLQKIKTTSPPILTPHVIKYILLIIAFIVTQDKVVEDNITGKKDKAAERFR